MFMLSISIIHAGHRVSTWCSNYWVIFILSNVFTCNTQFVVFYPPIILSSFRLLDSVFTNGCLFDNVDITIYF